MSPSNACRPENFLRVYKTQFKNQRPETHHYYTIGERVRISIQKKIFEKGATPNWTEEIFKISHILPTRPVTYRIEDLMGTQVDGAFYPEQLRETDQEIYRVDRVIRRRIRNGTREAYVSWSGYPSKFNQWIHEDDIHVGGR